MILDYLFWMLLVINAVILLISLYNLLTAPRISDSHTQFESDEVITILIPARNEEKNIERCLSSIVKQSYKSFEVIVLDDNSSDKTAQMVTDISQRDKRIRLINGKSLPEGWLGKNWACHQLAEAAGSNLIIFIDADVYLAEDALENALLLFKKNNVSMLSVFPTQLINNSGVYFVVPLMNWLLLSFLPLKKVFTSVNKKYVAANGQFMMFDKSAYLAIGGHKSVKQKIVEDMELARRIKSSGYKCITALGGSRVFCRMYGSLSESITGFSKNFYPGFNLRPAMFYLILLFIQFTFLLPFIWVFINSKLIGIVLIIILERIIISIMSRQNFIINSLLHPFQMLLSFIIGINSVRLTLRKRNVWKGRII